MIYECSLYLATKVQGLARVFAAVGEDSFLSVLASLKTSVCVSKHFLHMCDTTTQLPG